MPAITGSKDLQNVNITLRILFRYDYCDNVKNTSSEKKIGDNDVLYLRPKPDALPEIYTTLGQDYDDRVKLIFK